MSSYYATHSDPLTIMYNRKLVWSRGVVPENKVATQVLPSRQNHKKDGERLASLTCERLVFLGWPGRPVTRVESEAWVGLGPMTGCGRFGRFHVFPELPWNHGWGFDVDWWLCSTQEECACLLLILGGDEFSSYSGCCMTLKTAILHHLVPVRYWWRM